MMIDKDTNTIRRGILALLAAPIVLFSQLFSQLGFAETSSPAYGIEELVVTARKRAENLQNTPISIAAFSGDNLDQRGISNVSDIDTFTPNLRFDRSTANSGDKSAASVYIRGVGQSDFVLTTDPGVGIYLDGVYIARSIGSAIDILDVERVEVLRGPQGTLFGRNTIGGAISITSRKPDDELAGSLSVSFGRYDAVDVAGKLNLPLADNLYSSWTLAHSRSDGYIDRPNLNDETGENDNWAARGAINWLPSANVEVDFSIDATRIRETSCCGELLAAYPNAALTGFHNAAIAPSLEPELGAAAFFDNGQLPTSEYQDNSTFDVPADLDLWGVSANVAWDIHEDLEFKSITAYRTFDSENGRDADHSPLLINHTLNIFENDQFSQEFQLLGTALDKKLNWILGAYYFKEDGFNEDDVDFSVVHLISGGFTENESKALFAQATYDLNDLLSLTAGYRWTDDRRSFVPRQFVIENRAGIPSTITGIALGPNDPITPSDEVSKSISETTPYLNFQQQWTDDWMTYLSYSEGFKSGGFVQRNFPDRTDIPDFDPEFVEVIEAGTKFSSADGRIRLNAAVFQTDYTNLQVQVFDGIAPVTQNAAAAEIKGAEVELTFVPQEMTLVELGIGYLDAEYTEIDPAATEVSLSNELTKIPEWTLSAGVSRLFELSNGGSLTPRIDWSYRDSLFNDARNTPELFQDSFSLLNASLVYLSPSEKWEVTLRGTNLTDERYIVSGFADDQVQSVAEGTFGRPLEWSLKVLRSF